MDVTKLGKRARDWRFEKRMLLSDMAELLGTNSAELRGYELGRRPWPDGVRRQLEDVMAF